MVVGTNPHDRKYSIPYLLEMEISMPMLPMAIVAKHLEVAPQTLWYYHKKGKLTALQAGRILLVDPEVAKKELKDAGFYEIREKRRSRKRSASTNE